MSSFEDILAGMDRNDARWKKLFVTDRLRLVIPPENEKPVHLLLPPQGSLAKRRIGALSLFLDLPLDVIFEAISYLGPADVLTLTRVSKEFRSLFLSRSRSLAVWRRVLAQVPGLPPCPEDLHEPQYASLLYDKFCMACGSNRGVITTHFRMRLRLCTQCAKRNLVSGDDVSSELQSDLNVLFLELFPSSGLIFQGLDLNDPELQQKVSILNDLEANYFRPEVEAITDHISMIEQMEDGESDYSEQGHLSLLIWEQISAASRMIMEGIALEQWREAQNEAAADRKDTLTAARYVRIMQEIATLGWQDQYFPTHDGPGAFEDFEQWTKYLFQAKEFSSRGWKAIRPKMEAIYLRTKEQVQIEILLASMEEAFLARRAAMPIERRRTIPGWFDAIDEPAWNEWGELTYATDWKAEDIAAFMDDYLSDASCFNNFTTRFEAGVVDSVMEFYVGSPDPSILKEARMLFKCPRRCCSDMQTFMPFRDVVDHVTEHHPEHGWFDTYSWKRPKIDAEIFGAGTDILQALGLRQDISYEEIDRQGKFICGCGHHLFRGPMSFEKLVFHVSSERLWYKRLWENVRPSRRQSAEHLLEDSHHRRHLRDLVERASHEENEYETPEDGADDQMSADNLARFACQWCYRVTRQVHLSQLTDETVDYHMRVKHGMERIMGDFVYTSDLEY